jgi:magnesium-transporting ATPase (P-type)
MLCYSDPVLVLRKDKQATFPFTEENATSGKRVVAQVGNVLACRTSKQSIFRTSIKTNKWILFGIASQLSILALIIYLPFLQSLFGTTALGIAD